MLHGLAERAGVKAQCSLPGENIFLLHREHNLDKLKDSQAGPLATFSLKTDLFVSFSQYHSCIL